MKSKIKTYIILFFTTLVLYFFVEYYTIYYELSSLGYCLRAINFILYMYFGIRIIYMIKNPLLVLLIPVMLFLVATVIMTSSYMVYRDKTEQKKDMGYYVTVAIVNDFDIICQIGWPYSIYLGHNKLYREGCAWLPNCDTILVGMLKTAETESHFIFKEHPTHEEIEHAKQGWYMEGDTEKRFNEYSYMFFKAIILKRDSIERAEAHKPRGKWIPRD